MILPNADPEVSGMSLGQQMRIGGDAEFTQNVHERGSRVLIRSIKLVHIVLPYITEVVL